MKIKELRKAIVELIRDKTSLSIRDRITLTDQLLNLFTKTMGEVIKNIVKELQKSFEIEYYEVNGKKFVNADQVQARVVRVFKKYGFQEMRSKLK
jgi:hypothetical protein